MTFLISDLSVFSSVYEINLSALPNQSFNSSIAGYNFDFKICTLLNLQTYLTIKYGDLVLCNFQNIKTQINLNYTSQFKDGAFFFLKLNNKNDIAYNYEDFNSNLGLYFGKF